jgi:ATP-binding cassette subfamily F protein 3
MLALNNVSYEFGGRYLYRDINWHIKPKERIGLVGNNGTGKTTLLRLITGEYELREGSISKTKTLEIGYLHQEMAEQNTDIPILDVAMQAFDAAQKVKLELDEVYAKMEEAYTDDLLARSGKLQEEFERLDGYNIKNKTEEILEGLGFKTEELTQPLSSFSGGWRMRVILARMLLSEPDLLMLDEPTNHLDLPSIEWLETYLQTFDGTVIVVSHDREFLNRMVTKIAEIANQNLYLWPGNYDHFLVAKEERDDLLRRQFENQQQFIKDQEKFINRFRAKASKATAVQSRVKMLDKLDKIELEESDDSNIRLDFKVAKQSGKVVLELKNINKSYGPKEIIKDGGGYINRGDKIALIGANGTGKSTLLRILAGTETFDGEKLEGYNVMEAFFAQHQLEALTLDNEILQELLHHAGKMTETEIRNLLGCFLFTGDDVFKPIKVLSGGEKSRVALAKTLVEQANFLLLDEPTNHLDIKSIEVLIQALQAYQGSFVVVSHDRYFLSKIANKIWWIEDRELKEYPGTYEEFQYWKSKQEVAVPVSKKKAEVKKSNKRPDKSEEKKTKQAIRKLTQKLEKTESEIAKIKEEIEASNAFMMNPDNAKDFEKLEEASKNHGKLTKALETLIAQEESDLEMLMELEEKLDELGD